VGHDGAARRALWLEPNKWHSIRATRFSMKVQATAQEDYQLNNRPAREEVQIRPTSEVEFLDVFPDMNWQHRPHKVIQGG
jgi:hypothetical protein